MRARLCAFMLCGFVLLAAPAGASAKPGCHGRTVSPHGNSEADQYSETIPGACGNHRPNPPADPGTPGGSPDGTVPAQTHRRLESLGPAGQNAAALAQANAPGGTRTNGGGDGGNGNPASAGDAGDGGALSGVGRALGGGSGDGEGMGVVLPLVLAGTLGAGLAYWLVRRRRAGPAS
jgi:hypothetical protein